MSKENKYHDKKYPVTIAVRITEKQAKKLGSNRSESIRRLINEM
jgi:hypothetical protein